MNTACRIEHRIFIQVIVRSKTNQLGYQSALSRKSYARAALVPNHSNPLPLHEQRHGPLPFQQQIAGPLGLATPQTRLRGLSN